MKVLHVFTLPTTAKSFFDGQFRHLSEREGHEVHVVTSRGDISEFCVRNKVAFTPIDIARRIDIKADIKSIFELRRLIKVEKYDVVFGHTPKGALVAMIASWLCRVPSRVYYRHGLIYTTARGIKRFIFKTVERCTALLATYIINVSPSLSDLAIADRLNGSRKQTVIGQGTCGGIDTKNTFNPELINQDTVTRLKYEYHIAQRDFVIGFCGRICKDKGIEELVEGFKLFVKCNPNISAKLLLVGGYDKRDVLGETVKREIANNPDIISVGKVIQKDLPLYYTMMDVFVFPSYREGFGMCVIEASAMEVPILVSRSHGCINSIVESKTGEYIDISPKGVCEGIERLLKDKHRKHYGISGRKWVKENFEQTVMWPQIALLYSELKK